MEEFKVTCTKASLFFNILPRLSQLLLANNSFALHPYVAVSVIT